jgi:hypothetical protein
MDITSPIGIIEHRQQLVEAFENIGIAFDSERLKSRVNELQ